MRKAVRQKMNGPQWDYTCKRTRCLIKWKRGEGKQIKRSLNRAYRLKGKNEIRRELKWD